MNEKLKTIDGETLINTAMQPMNFIIDNILPEAGRFALQNCSPMQPRDYIF